MPTMRASPTACATATRGCRASSSITTAGSTARATKDIAGSGNEPRRSRPAFRRAALRGGSPLSGRQRMGARPPDDILLRRTKHYLPHDRSGERPPLPTGSRRSISPDAACRIPTCRLTLSLNTNPLVNRFADPDDLIETVARDLSIRDLQLTHEFINPSWPAPVIRRLTRQMDRRPAAHRRARDLGHDRPLWPAQPFRPSGCATCGATMSTGSRPSPTSPPISAACRSAPSSRSSPTGTTTIPPRREELIKIAIDCWAEVAEHAKAAGLAYMFWEPMSVGREFGETIASIRRSCRTG